MNHFRGHSGYSLLVFLLSIGLCLACLIIIGIFSMLGVTGIQPLTPFFILLMLFAASFLTTGRFIEIENRKPKLYDVNTVAMQTAAYLVTLFVSIFVFITLLTWISKGDMSKLLSLQTLSGAGLGIFGFTLVCYLMIFLNFSVLSRFRLQELS